MNRPPEPWHSLFIDLDLTIGEEVGLYCFGGFIVVVVYGFPRVTGDVDFVTIEPYNQIGVVLSAAGAGSPLHRKHRIYLQHVAVATLPENYKERVVEIFAGCYQRLRFFALDPHDLALSKLERNWDWDREDVKHLHRSGYLNIETLQERYRFELRPYIANPYGREDLTMRLWVEMLSETIP